MNSYITFVIHNTHYEFHGFKKQWTPKTVISKYMHLRMTRGPLMKIMFTSLRNGLPKVTNHDTRTLFYITQFLSVFMFYLSTHYLKMRSIIFLFRKYKFQPSKDIISPPLQFGPYTVDTKTWWYELSQHNVFLWDSVWTWCDIYIFLECYFTWKDSSLNYND